MITIFLISCEKDYPNQMDTSSISLENAPFKQEVTTTSDDGTFTFKLSSNNEKLINAINENSISLEFLDELDINDSTEEELTGDVSDEQNQFEENDEDSLKDRAFIGISLVKMKIADDEIDEMSPYKIQLNESLLDIIREFKAVTVFDFESEAEVNNVVSNRKRQDTFTTSGKKILIIGKCVQTKTRSFLSGPNAPKTIVSNFKCSAKVTSCCKGKTSFVNKVKVLKGVVKDVVVLSKNCHNSTKCLRVCD